MVEVVPRILNVGHCMPDHTAISRMLVEHFHAVVESADSAQAALERARTEGFDLILVNRVFDADAYEGLALIEHLKADPATAQVPIMLVSNYDDAQASAVELGAERGFGKSSILADDTIRLLAVVLR